ncbi:MAG: uroporphyrinogen-III synthase [Betaproteobacteria bacterium]|nr:MAG: uroporphyrinogen-III synthase [Betaproteobacteria bacterium]
MTDRVTLRGAGILITRPARQAAGLAREVAALGGTPVIFPAVIILPPDDRSKLLEVQRELSNYDYAVFVSANAVEYGVGDAADWPSKLIAFAPGPGTAAALAAFGVTAVRTPQTSMDSEGLLALPEFEKVSGKRIVIFRGGDGRELLGETLAARGAHIDHIECYRRAKPSRADGLEQPLREDRIDAVTLTSSEGLDNLWSILSADGRRRLSAIPAFMPHARIAERARSLGVSKIIVTQPADAGLVAALLEYFAAQ